MVRQGIEAPTAVTFELHAVSVKLQREFRLIQAIICLSTL